MGSHYVLTELKSIDAGVYFVGRRQPDTAAHFYADIEMFTDGPASPIRSATWPPGSH